MRPEPLHSPDRLEDHVDVGVAEGAPARLGGDGVAVVVTLHTWSHFLTGHTWSQVTPAVVDVRAPHHAPALDEVVRVQPARVLDPGLQHPGMNQLDGDTISILQVINPECKSTAQTDLRLLSSPGLKRHRNMGHMQTLFLNSSIRTLSGDRSWVDTQWLKKALIHCKDFHT